MPHTEVQTRCARRQKSLFDKSFNTSDYQA